MKVFVRDGRLTVFSEFLLICWVLFGFFGIPYFNVPFWIAIPVWIVTVLAIAVLRFEGRAVALGIRPFTNDPLGWRKAKKSYRDEETVTETKKSDDHL